MDNRDDTLFPGWDVVIDSLRPEIRDSQWWDDDHTDAEDYVLHLNWRAQMKVECRHIITGPEHPPLVFRWKPQCWVVAYDGGNLDDPDEQPTFLTHVEAIEYVRQYVGHPAWLLTREAVTSRDDLAQLVYDAARANSPVDAFGDDPRLAKYQSIWANAAATSLLAAGWVPGDVLAAEQARNATLTDTIQAARALVDDWNGNGNSRELSDPCPYVWYQCARELLAALDGPGEEDG